MEHLFDIDIAKRYGVDGAIIIRHFQFWIIKNRADGRHRYDGRIWTYGSVKSFTEIFVYWTEAQVRQILKKLLVRKVLRKGHYSKIGYDRTTWYAFEDEKAFLQAKKPICENSQMDLRKQTNGSEKNREPITDESTDIRKDRRKDKRPPPEILAHEKYRQAKAECQDLPQDFLLGFEREVLGRWNKYSITPAILGDWHDRLYAKYKPKVITEALQIHRAGSTNWSPEFAEIVKIAAKLRAKELAVLRQKEVRKSRLDALKKSQAEAKQPRMTMAESCRQMKPEELVAKYEADFFTRSWIDTHRPEIIKDARSKISKQPLQIRSRSGLKIK